MAGKFEMFKYGPDGDRWGLASWTVRYIVVFWLSMVILFGGGITGLLFGVNSMQRMFTHESCVNWGIQNDRTSKFVSYQLFDYACVTKAYDGKWVSIDNPQQFIPLNVNTKGTK